MKLNEILSDSFNAAEWEAKGYQLPQYDIAAVAKKTHDEPTWVHFGAGNIFRAFPAAILNDALNTGKYDRGVIVAESFDYEIIDKAYRPYHNLSLLVSLQSNGTIEKKVIASITESLKADKQFGEDWARLVQIFQAPSLQMVTFTITEKGYSFNDADLARGLDAVFAMGKLTALLYERYKAGKLPVTLQSTDNCSHNGDHVKAGVKAYAERWVKDGIVEAGFLDYVNDSSKVTYPWSMIDKITPRPHEKVQAMLAELLTRNHIRLMAIKKYLYIVLAIIMLAIVFLTGGRSMWIQIGSISIQPSEFMKPVFVLLCATSIMEQHEKTKVLFFYVSKEALLLTGSFLAIFLLQWWCRDLGSLPTFAASYGCAIICRICYPKAKFSKKTLIFLCCIGAAIVLAAVKFAPGYVQDRLSVDIWNDMYGNGYQQCRALMAIAEGGLFGKGPGYGDLIEIAAADTDIVFSTICEEWGFLVALLVIFFIVSLLILPMINKPRSYYHTPNTIVV